MEASMTALGGFCEDSFWDEKLLTNGSWPEFTECFQETVLVWVPCGFLWLCSPFYTWHLATSPVRASRNTYSKIFLSKLVLTSLLIAMSAFEVFDVAVVSPDQGASTITATVTTTITFVLAFCFTVAERRKRFVTSGVLFLFWVFQVICNIIPFYTQVAQSQMHDHNLSTFMTSCVRSFVLLAVLVLHCFAEVPVRSERPGWKPCPESDSSFLSRILFSWQTPMLLRGYKHPLTEDVMPDLNERDKSGTVVPAFLATWNQAGHKDKMRTVYESVTFTTESLALMGNLTNGDPHKPDTDGESCPGRRRKEIKKKRGPSLVWALCQTFGPKLLHSQVWKLFYAALYVMNPLILGLLVAFVKDPSAGSWQGYVIALALFSAGILQTIFFHQLFHYAFCLAMQVRASLISTIFRKSLTIENAATKESSAGKIANLMSVDVDNVTNFIKFFYALWCSPLQIAVCLYLLYGQLGVAMFSSATFLFLLIPVNLMITTRVKSLQAKLLKFKDERVKVMNELLSGIKIIKLFAWEESFEKKVLAIRDKEIKILFKFAILETLFGLTWTVAPYMVNFMTFVTFVYVNGDHHLDPQTAFVTLALLEVVKYAMHFGTTTIKDGMKALVSARRIEWYLHHGDLDEDSVTKEEHGDGDAIVIDNGTFSWSTEQKQPTLTNISVRIGEGSLVGVVGSVGSGKSSLLSSMLGEMDKTEGHVNIKGSISYVPQQAWIQNDTLRNNILFGKAYDADLYNRCIEACALEPDLNVLPNGDLTEIGEKGINLSGGQKQRVSLARAVYNQADVYLMDDPLSAVDSHVGKHIFNNILSDTGMLAGKVRVLVTHGLHWLPYTDHVIVLTNGQVSESGHYHKLLSHNGDFAKLVTALLTQDDEKYENTNTNNDHEDEEYKQVKEMAMTNLSLGDGNDVGCSVDVLRTLSIAMERSYEATRRSDEDIEKEGSKSKGPQKTNTNGGLIEVEAVNTGSVKFSVVKTYWKALGYVYLAVFACLFAVYIATDMGANLWLSHWTDDASLGNFTQLPRHSGERMDRNNYFLAVYGILGLVKTISIVGSRLVGNLRAVHAARALHHAMLACILHAPMSFFDTTPIGRVVNRLAKDVSDVDTLLPLTINDWMDTTLVVASGLVIISYTTPLSMIVTLPLAVLYFCAQRFFIATTRQLKRLSSKTKSPIFNHFNEALTGAPVIRAFGAQSRFVNASEKKVDDNQVFDFYSYCSNRWLAVRLESLSNVMTLTSASIAVLTRDSVSPGMVGLMIVYTFQITRQLNWLVRMTSELETQIVSVERIKEYSEIDAEAPWHVANAELRTEWPWEGVIQFDHLSLRYRPGLELVLKDLTFTVRGGEKVGLVGRTGAGKSTLTLALFRLIEPAEGRILLDGVDISRLGLHHLRSKVTILPQDPVIFSGTLRQNLDPFDEYASGAIWTAIRRCHLAKFVESLPNKLDHECGEGGENLSYGQRQLLCLGRALLRESKILILDEATAAVDMETDELLQKTIRQAFKHCTVLTIAHRLHTVMDYDRILVLEKGEINDFDTPDNLLQKTDGLFYSMAKAANLVTR